jgi:hypothetical protein
MFFSVKHLYEHAQQDYYELSDEYEELVGQRRGNYGDPLTLSECRKLMKVVKDSIVRQDDSRPFKWLRPWHVVPELANFRPPEGDFGIGVEVEMGFNSKEDASFFVDKLKNWRHVAFDSEGGCWEHGRGSSWGVETTFAPFLYSKMSKDRQAFRFLKLLQQNQERVYAHRPSSIVGTHINVSTPSGSPGYDRIRSISLRLSYLSMDQKTKYFNRDPYDYGFDQSSHVEWKLFNSVPDPAALRRYVNIAVALTALAAGTDPITDMSVLAALESGYNKE